MPLVSALIVVYNPRDEFIECLESLYKILDEYSLEIIVVDNASSNNFLDAVKARFPQVQFVRSDENLGFGGGNNLAFEYASGDYIICVNPDLVMNEAAFKTMLTIIKGDSTIGIVGPRTTDTDGNLVYTARADYTVARLVAKYLGLDKFIPHFVYGDYPEKMKHEEQPFETDWLQGSCLLMHRETYDSIGGFDDSFFLYLEDTDICHRVRYTGKKVIYVPTAVVSHAGGTTTSKYHGIRVKSYHHSPIHYHRKQGHTAGVWLLKLVFTFELATKILARTILNFFRPDDIRQEHIKSEMDTLKQLRFF